MGQQQNINLIEFLNPLYRYECRTTRKIQTLLEFTDDMKFT